MKTRVISIVFCIFSFVATLLLFQNCSQTNDDTGNNATAGISEVDFNNKLMLLLANAGVSVSTATGAYATFNIPTILCGFTIANNRTECFFIKSQAIIYGSYLPEAVEIYQFLKNHSAPTYIDEGGSEYVYIRDVNCTGNMLNLTENSSCSFSKNICETFADCIPDYAPEVLPIDGGDGVIVDPSSPGSGDGGSNLSNGFTVDFIPTSLQSIQDFGGSRSVSVVSPTDIKLNINLSHVTDGRYGGTITISYYDNGQLREGTFEAGTGRNPSYKGMHDNDKLQSEYNYWFDFENQTVFTAFFEDTFGALTIALEPEVVSGGGNDAEPLNVKYKGSVYFKNFAPTGWHMKSPYRSCWHVYAGPFDCRSSTVQTKSGLSPEAEAGYQLLGTFTNVDIKQAFNIQ